MTALAHDAQLLNGASPPRFPASLLVQDKAYLEAGESGRAAEVSAEGAALGVAIETLLESDRQRLGALSHGLASRDEREFLRARAIVLETRLDSVTGPGSLPEPPVEPAPPTPPTPTPEQAGPERREAALAQDEPAPEHRKDIQGLRAVAVLLVALDHAGVGFLQGGFIGVDVFFVLSGFLITGLLLSEARRRRYVSLAEFYLRRARRILPAATLTLIVTDLAAHHLLNFVRAKQTMQDSISSVLFTANIHFAAQGTDYFAQGQPPSPLQHFWSLSVEEQFYVVWPALFAVALGLALRRYAPRPQLVRDRAVRRVLIVVIAIAGASMAWSIHYTSVQPAGAYFSTLARAWELALGAALALGAPRLAGLPARWRIGMGWGGLACIAIAAVTFSGSTPFPGYAALLPTVGAALLIGAGVATTYLRHSTARVLAPAPLRYVGDRSYAFYLWHWPVLVIAAEYEGHNLSVGTNLLLLLAAFALSIVSYRLVEQPIRSAEWARRPESVLAWAGSVMAVLLLATTYISSINDRETRQSLQAAGSSAPALSLAPAPPVVPQSNGASAAAVSQVLPAVIDAVNSGSRSHGVPAALNPPVGQLLDDTPNVPADCIAHNGESTSNICSFGVSSSSKTIVVIGDSHAEMWMPALVSLAQRDGWLVRPILKSGCSPLDWAGSTGPGDCHAWLRWATHEGGALRPDVTLIAGLYSYDGPGHYQSVTDGLDNAVAAMKKRSKRIVIIGDIPERDREPVDCLLAPHASAAGCSDSLNSNEAELTSLVAQTAGDEQVGFIDPTGWFCYEDQCPLVVGNIITYRDANHVSRTYAAALSGAFRAAFNLAVRPGA